MLLQTVLISATTEMSSSEDKLFMNFCIERIVQSLLCLPQGLPQYYTVSGSGLPPLGRNLKVEQFELTINYKHGDTGTFNKIQLLLRRLRAPQYK